MSFRTTRMRVRNKVSIHVGAWDEITLWWPAAKGTLALEHNGAGMRLRPKAVRRLRDACDRYLQEHGT